MIIQIRNEITRNFYRLILKPFFFRLDPEFVHDRMIILGKLLGSNPVTKFITRLKFSYSNKKLEQYLLGIKFKNPIGLGGGFDKNAELTQILPCVGFGFIEVGSITGEACEGNPKPRLWRVPKQKSLLVYYGLKNDGAETISNKLKNKKFSIPLGINIAKTNSKETVDLNMGIKDYVKAFKAFRDIGSYFTINISCPNAFGGEPFTNPKSLDKLLSELDKIETTKPIFLKLSPDLSKKEINVIIEVIQKHRIHGFICTNLTKKRRVRDLPEFGGYSGKMVEDKSTELVSYIYNKTKGNYVLIGLGGVFTAEDAYKKIKAGASLVQLVTGMIYQGPQSISDINLGLVKLMKKDGYNHISEVVGTESKNI